MISSYVPHIFEIITDLRLFEVLLEASSSIQIFSYPREHSESADVSGTNSTRNKVIIDANSGQLSAASKLATSRESVGGKPSADASDNLKSSRVALSVELMNILVMPLENSMPLSTSQKLSFVDALFNGDHSPALALRVRMINS